MRRCPTMTLMLAVTLVLSGTVQADETTLDAQQVARRRAGNALGLYAKLLCSGVFVCEREPQEFIENDLQRAGLPLPGWDAIKVRVDRTGQSVTLRFKASSKWGDLPPRTAVFNGSQGCTLLPLGEERVFFKPVAVESALPPASQQAWPLGDVLPDAPLPAEVDEPALAAALDFAFDDSQQSVPQNTRAIVVLHEGRLIAERYADGFDQHSRHVCWSMGKSITAALVGLLVGESHFDVDDPAPIPQWRQRNDPRGAITIADLLHMSGGLKFGRGTAQNGLYFTEGDHHTAVYFGAVNVFDYSVARELEHPPNTVWRYRNCDPLALGSIVRNTVEAGRGDYLSYPQRELFDKIGARNFVLEVDAWGNFIMTGFDYGTARDWARFGLLHLQDGVFAGQRVLPEGWVDFIRAPAPANEAKNYGGLFWLNAGGQYEKLPRDMYWPAGHHGQVVMTIPSHDMVIVRIGHSALGGFGPYIAEVTHRILASVEAGDE